MTSDNYLLLIAAARCLFMGSVYGAYYAFFGQVWFNRPVRAGRLAISCVVLSVATLIRTFEVGGPVLSTLAMAVGTLSIALISWLPMAALRFIFCFFACLVSEFVIEFAGDMVFIRLFSDQIFSTPFGNAQVMTATMLATVMVCMLVGVFVFIVLWIPYSIRKRKRIGGIRRYWLRTIFILILTMGTLVFISINAMHFLHDAILSGETSNVQNYAQLNIPVYFIPVAILILFFWELTQQFLLFRNNRALSDRNAAYQSILDSKREFAHNIANLIYGFEGVILTEDMTAIRSYYNELSRRCVLNNNENANALNSINNPVLTALLLRKLNRATELEIPVYLTADSSFTFDGLPPARLADVVGNLLDNAIEAAQKSDSPRVDITLCRTDDMDTILIDNTFSQDADLSFLSGTMKSSKPDHQATGLESIRRTLKHTPMVYCNQYLRGRYVETNLCDYHGRGH